MGPGDKGTHKLLRARRQTQMRCDTARARASKCEVELTTAPACLALPSQRLPPPARSAPQAATRIPYGAPEQCDRGERDRNGGYTVRGASERSTQRMGGSPRNTELPCNSYTKCIYTQRYTRAQKCAHNTQILRNTTRPGHSSKHDSKRTRATSLEQKSIMYTQPCAQNTEPDRDLHALIPPCPSSRTSSSTTTPCRPRPGTRCTCRYSHHVGRRCGCCPASVLQCRYALGSCRYRWS